MRTTAVQLGDESFQKRLGSGGRWKRLVRGHSGTYQPPLRRIQNGAAYHGSHSNIITSSFPRRLIHYGDNGTKTHFFRLYDYLTCSPPCTDLIEVHNGLRYLRLDCLLDD